MTALRKKEVPLHFYVFLHPAIPAAMGTQRGNEPELCTHYLTMLRQRLCWNCFGKESHPVSILYHA